MRIINKTGFALRRTLHLVAFALTALLVASTAQAELNWKSSGTPSVSCEVTKVEADYNYPHFGQWKYIDLTYYVTEDPEVKIMYICSSTASLNPGAFNCRAKRGNYAQPWLQQYFLVADDNPKFSIKPGVNKLDVCVILHNSAGIKAYTK